MHTVFMLIKRYKSKIHYRRIGIVEIPGNEFVSLDWWTDVIDRNCRRNWASTAMPSLPCAAFRAFVTVIPGTCATATRWHSGGVCDCCDPRKWTPTAMPHAHAAFWCCISALHFGGVAIVIPRNGHHQPRCAEFRENLFVTKDSCIPGNRYQLPCHALRLEHCTWSTALGALHLDESD